MTSTNLKKRALKILEKVNFYPPGQSNRLISMVKNRPDWLISRQRKWGVPLPIFLNKKTLKPLIDAEINEHICQMFATHGSDIWFTASEAEFLKHKYIASEYIKVQDIVDVWFEAGTSHRFVVRKQLQHKGPADLYLEGTDQHRGWFQSSLLTTVETQKQAPYKGVFTHGFVLDDQKLKMSKSLGNTLEPQTVINKYGADIIRLWAISANYHADISIGDTILEGCVSEYRKIRNVCRFLISYVNSPKAIALDPVTLPELEQFILHRLATVCKKVDSYIPKYKLNLIYKELYNFFTFDLSAFYLDIRKDTLYCKPKVSPERVACIKVINVIFHALITRLAPILPFTMEQLWQHTPAFESGKLSIHLETIKSLPKSYMNPALAATWEGLLNQRTVIQGALESARSQGTITTTSEANVILSPEAFKAADLEKLQLITLVANIERSADCVKKISIEPLKGDICARCRYTKSKLITDLCAECYEIINS